MEEKSRNREKKTQETTAHGDNFLRALSVFGITFWFV